MYYPKMRGHIACVKHPRRSNRSVNGHRRGYLLEPARETLASYSICRTFPGEDILTREKMEKWADPEEFK